MHITLNLDWKVGQHCGGKQQWIKERKKQRRQEGGREGWREAWPVIECNMWDICCWNKVGVQNAAFQDLLSISITVGKTLHCCRTKLGKRRRKKPHINDKSRKVKKLHFSQNTKRSAWAARFQTSNRTTFAIMYWSRPYSSSPEQSNPLDRHLSA